MDSSSWGTVTPRRNATWSIEEGKSGAKGVLRAAQLTLPIRDLGRLSALLAADFGNLGSNWKFLFVHTRSDG